MISVCTAESPHFEGKYSLRKTDEAFCLSNYEIYLFQEDHASGGEGGSEGRKVDSYCNE